jgi:hypothetical protein
LIDLNGVAPEFNAQQEFLMKNSLKVYSLAALLAAALGASSASAQVVVPQAGFWTDANATNGRGLVIEVVAATGEIFASMQVYDATGRAIWYVVNTVPNAGVRNGQLQQFVGGQSLTSGLRSGTYLGTAGTATFVFDTPTFGTLTLPTGDMQIQRYNMVAGGVSSGPAAGAPAGGWWWNASESGRGYFIEAQGSTLGFTAFEYNDLGQATWYYAQGAMTTPTLFSGALFESYGGQTMSGAYRQASQNYARGNITIQFSSTTQLTLTEPNGRQTVLTRYGF